MNWMPNLMKKMMRNQIKFKQADLTFNNRMSTIFIGLYKYIQSVSPKV
jgi:hypothetical protein